MAKLLLDNSEMPESYWRRITIAPWNGDLWLKLRPYTQALRDLVAQRAKRNRWSRPHDVVVDKETIHIESDEDKARGEEFVKAIVEDWRGVEGEPACTPDNRVMLRGSMLLMGHITGVTIAMAGVKNEDEVENS